MTLTLTDPARDVLDLLMKQHSTAETAGLLGITEIAVDRRLQRAQRANGGLSRWALKRQFLKERRRKR